MARASQENKIIEAALDCFAELGYEGTRVRHIADKAGVAESALYRHYASKEDIARTIYRHCLESLLEKFQVIQHSSEPVRVKLQQFISVAISDYRTHPAAFSYIMLHKPNIEQCLPTNSVSPLEVIAAVIIEGQQQGQIREGSPAVLAASFIGCFLQPVALAQMPIFQAIDPALITDNEQLLIEMGWAMLANPTNTPL